MKNHVLFISKQLLADTLFQETRKVVLQKKDSKCESFLPLAFLGISAPLSHKRKKQLTQQTAKPVIKLFVRKKIP